MNVENNFFSFTCIYIKSSQLPQQNNSYIHAACYELQLLKHIFSLDNLYTTAMDFFFNVVSVNNAVRLLIPAFIADHEKCEIQHNRESVSEKIFKKIFQ